MAAYVHTYIRDKSKSVRNTLINIKIQPFEIWGCAFLSREGWISLICVGAAFCAAPAHFSSVYEICNFLIFSVILISLLFIPSSRLLFSPYHRLSSALSQSEFYCLSSFPPRFFPRHFSYDTGAEYNICRNCIIHFIIISITAALIRLKLRLLEYNLDVIYYFLVYLSLLSTCWIFNNELDKIAFDDLAMMIEIIRWRIHRGNSYEFLFFFVYFYGDRKMIVLNYR